MHDVVGGAGLDEFFAERVTLDLAGAEGLGVGGVAVVEEGAEGWVEADEALILWVGEGLLFQVFGDDCFYFSGGIVVFGSMEGVSDLFL